MSPSEIVATLREPASAVSSSSGPNCLRNSEDNRRFADLRGVRWRINLEVLPSSSLASIDDLRRVTADSRRRYAILRRRHLVDPHISKDESKSPDIAIDNPLSQNPDSMWGRFFRGAELEKMVDQDLSRLYPEHGSYFQTPGCQGLLRRILLLWCLQHPQFGYRQGMHELLAPLLYVLHVDVERLSHVRKIYEDQFADKFDGLSFRDSGFKYNFDFKSRASEDEFGIQGNVEKVKSLAELDPEIQTIVLLTDAYGAEGELGIVLSERFIEHDAYTMFDALMSGARGSVAMADFFSPSPAGGSLSGLPPVIEASAALYHLLSHVDSSLHAHLVELGVEPQYFSLRWLRVLFGREFSLEDLLTIWDKIFASDNSKFEKSNDETTSSFVFLSSSRGAFIAAIAVSMLLYLRSSLLATENATSCLQRLLNFPKNVDLKKMIEKATSLQTLAMDINISSTPSSYGAYDIHSKSMAARGNGLSSGSVSPKTPLNLVPESYWEEKWRVLHREEESKRSGSSSQIATQKRGWSDKMRFLYRTESDPSPAKLSGSKKNTNSSVRRRLLADLSRELGAAEDIKKSESDGVLDNKDNLSVEGEIDGHDGSEKYLENAIEKICESGNAGSEENSSVFSDPTSSFSAGIDQENDLNDSSRSSVASNCSLEDNDDQSQSVVDDSPLQTFDQFENTEKLGCDNDSKGDSVTGTKDRKQLLGKFQWLWKFGRAASSEGKVSIEAETSKLIGGDSIPIKNIDSPKIDGSCNASVSFKGDGVDQNVMGTLRNLGQSMFEHIQVIEAVFQQERGQVGSIENISRKPIVGKGQVTAMAALKELRKISNLLSEM